MAKTCRWLPLSEVPCSRLRPMPLHTEIPSVTERVDDVIQNRFAEAFPLEVAAMRVSKVAKLGEFPSFDSGVPDEPARCLEAERV